MSWVQRPLGDAAAFLLALAAALLIAGCGAEPSPSPSPSLLSASAEVSSVSGGECILVRLDQTDLGKLMAGMPRCVVLIYDTSMPGVVTGDPVILATSTPRVSPGDDRIHLSPGLVSKMPSYTLACHGTTRSHGNWRFGDLPDAGVWVVNVVEKYADLRDVRAVCDQLVATLKP